MEMGGGEVEGIAALGRKVIESVGTVIVGKPEQLRTVWLAILSEGHVLLEDFPGLAKTLMARSFAQVLGCSFRRVQFTPDLLPADITGAYIYDQSAREFKLRPGPLFANVVLGDEINRAPPKTQSAMLEAMQEHQVTIEGDTYPLERPFVVFATQNPIEFEGTYPLPEAQVDRFLVRLSIGYPDETEEEAIVQRRLDRRKDEADLPAATDAAALLGAQQMVESVYVDPELSQYIVAMVRKTRAHPHVEVGASPRGSLALMKLARASAAADGREFALPDDVKRVAIPGLAHRLILKPDPWVKGVRAETIVKEIVDRMPVPKMRPPPAPAERAAARAAAGSAVPRPAMPSAPPARPRPPPPPAPPA
jgi:MoxR-like ATPase